MTLKNVIQPNHVPINKYELSVLGLPKIIFTQVSGIEQETQKVTLPDRTSASGGQSEPFEVTAQLPLHHDNEVGAIESWYKEGQDPVSATYKKPGTMLYKRIDDSVAKTYSLIGMWVSKLKMPDADMSNEGEPAMVEVTFTVDDYDIL